MGFSGRRRNAVTHAPVTEGKAQRFTCCGYEVRGSAKFIADAVASYNGICPSCGASMGGGPALEYGEGEGTHLGVAITPEEAERISRDGP